MPSHRAVVAVALLAGLAGAAASLLLEPTTGVRLASTALGQRVLGAALQARAPAPPAGLAIARTGAPLPAMTLHDVDGVAVEVPRAWAGRVTLVNLWATWCGPCLKEMPDLQAFSATQDENGVQVVGIALDEADAVRAFLPAHGITYPVLVNAPGPADAGVRLGNPAGVLPFSALVAADGRLLKTRIGPFADAADIAAWTADAAAR